VKLVFKSLGSILGVIAEFRMPTHNGEGTWPTHSLTRLGRHLRQFLGVRCGRVKLVSSSLGSTLGVIAEFRMLTHKGRVPGLSIVRLGWGDPCANFLGSVAVVFWGFCVRCGMVKLVSSSLGSILGVIAGFRMPTHKGDGAWDTHSLTRLGRPLRQFFVVRCGSFLRFWGPVR